MAKILGSWSGMRKYLEQEMLAPCLRGRIRYECTSFVGMDGCRVFSICVDDVVVQRFSWETANSALLPQKPNPNPHGVQEYWAGFWDALEAVPLSERQAFTDGEFCSALFQYRQQDIQKSLASDNPLVRLFAILDRRVGKRSLQSAQKALSQQPAWLRPYYELRLHAEGLETEAPRNPI